MTCEVTPHHLALTDEAVAASAYDTNTKMNPPLRSAADREAVLQALYDGTVDAIASDHSPHHRDEKELEFAQAPFGIVGLETAVGLAVDRLVHGRVIGVMQLVRLMSTRPARCSSSRGARSRWAARQISPCSTSAAGERLTRPPSGRARATPRSRADS